MGIHYIDGTRLKNAVMAGAHRVIQMQERLNNINVFPVPDGDTGTNMALTLKSVADGAVSAHERHLATVSAVLAEAALVGARGNSGVILAQFFQGLAEGFKGLERVHQQHFAQAVAKAAMYAREAISEPREGTILTVIQDWANDIQQRWNTTKDFVALFSDALQTASQSLQETPKKLKVLAKAGVVDAGAQGFVNMLEGIAHYIETGKIGSFIDQTIGGHSARAIVDPDQEEDLTYQYCTECYLRGINLDPKTIRLAVKPLGDSLIVAGGSESIRIHIHTNEPEKLFKIAGRFGEVISTKKEDMWDQFSHEHRHKTDELAIITDSTCGLPPDYFIRHKIRVVPLSIVMDDEVFQDGVTITNDDFYYRLKENPALVPKTSQPPPAAFQEAYLLAAENHKQALGLFLSASYSGTWQNGLTVAKRTKDIDVDVIDTKTLSGGLGFLVQIAVEAQAEGHPKEEIKRRIRIAMEHIYCFVSVNDVELMIKGGRVSRFKGMLANFFNLKPVVGFLPDGHVHLVAKSRGGRPNHRKVIDLVQQKADGCHHRRFCVVHSHEPDGAQFMVDQLKQLYNVDDVSVLPIAAVAGAHSGRGAVGVCMLAYPEGTEGF